MASPLVSIIIPTYNRAHLIGDTLQSVLQQTYQNWECIVVDDLSTDDTDDVMKEWMEKDDRFKYFKRDREPKGAPTCRNIGANKARGEYIAFLDSDDEYLAEHLERRVKRMTTWHVDFIYGSGIVNWNGTNSISQTRQIREEERPLDFLLGDGNAYTASFFLKKAVANSIQWDESLKRHQDYDFFMKVHKKFKVLADLEATIKINWVGVRNVDFDSCISFMEKHFKEISPKIFLQYNKLMHDYCYLKPETVKHARYYKQKAKCLIKYISLFDFLSYYNKKSFLKIQFLKLYFIYMNLINTHKRCQKKRVKKSVFDGSALSRTFVF